MKDEMYNCSKEQLEIVDILIEITKIELNRLTEYMDPERKCYTPGVTLQTLRSIRSKKTYTPSRKNRLNRLRELYLDDIRTYLSIRKNNK